jgi:hypothetical protein
MVCALLLVGSNACRAQTTFTVSLDTTSLIGNGNGPFSLDFQLSDGSGTNDGNNTATLSNFSFDSGSASGTATTTGGASGSLMSGITLIDNGFFNDLFQSFTPGNVLTFDVALTDNADVGPTPDEFAFAILDNTLSEIPTTGAAGAFLIADLNPQGITLQTFAGVSPYASIGAPGIAFSVPEPGLLPMLGAGLSAGVLRLFRFRFAAALPPSWPRPGRLNG